MIATLFVKIEAIKAFGLITGGALFFVLHVVNSMVGEKRLPFCEESYPFEFLSIKGHFAAVHVPMDALKPITINNRIRHPTCLEGFFQKI